MTRKRLRSKRRLAGALRCDDWGAKGTCSFFLGKKKEPKKKPILSFSRLGYFHSIHLVTVFFIREAARDYRFTLLTYAEPAAFVLSLTFAYHAIRYLERFGIPRAGFSCLDRFRPRCVHRHASGAAHSCFGALPALNHISKLSAGRYFSPARQVVFAALHCPRPP